MYIRIKNKLKFKSRFKKKFINKHHFFVTKLRKYLFSHSDRQFLNIKKYHSPNSFYYVIFHILQVLAVAMHNLNLAARNLESISFSTQGMYHFYYPMFLTLLKFKEAHGTLKNILSLFSFMKKTTIIKFLSHLVYRMEIVLRSFVASCFLPFYKIRNSVTYQTLYNMFKKEKNNYFKNLSYLYKRKIRHLKKSLRIFFYYVSYIRNQMGNTIYSPISMVSNLKIQKLNIRMYLHNILNLHYMKNSSMKNT